MTETSTLTAGQELFNKLGTQHPQKQLLILLKRIEALEEKKPVDLVSNVNLISRSEKMKAAWIRRKAKAINKVGVITA